MKRTGLSWVLAGMLAATWMSAASTPLLASQGAASAASAPRESPYVRAARQHAQEASAPAPKTSQLQRHRPRAPTSTRHG